MGKPRRRNRPRTQDLNKRTAVRLVSGHDWAFLDPDPHASLTPASERELREIWREHGHALLAWAAGERELPVMGRIHLCRFRLGKHCGHPRCDDEQLPMWALQQFGPPESLEEDRA